AAPEPDRADHRLRLDPDPPGDPLRGRSLVPRRRRQLRHAELGSDDLRGNPGLQRRLVVHALPRPGPGLHGPGLQLRRRRDAGCPQPAQAAKLRERGRRKHEMNERHSSKPKGRTMRMKVLRVLIPGTLVVAALVLAACGSSDSTSSSGTSEAAKQYAAPTEAPSDAQSGGDLTVIAASDVDYIDPGAAYYQFTYMVTSATLSPLESYAPADIEQATPTLATEAPTVSDDGKTVTYKIHDDVKFSPPVNRTVTSDDVKYAIERSLLPGVPNGFVQTYMSGVEGIDKAIKEAQDNPTGGAPDISGITTPDDTTLEIKLTTTTSIGVIGALTLPVSAPVPEEYAKQYDAEN